MFRLYRHAQIFTQNLCVGRLPPLWWLLLLTFLATKAFGQDFSSNPDNFDGNLDLKPTDVIIWQGVAASINGNNIEVDLRLTTKQNFTLYVDKVTFAGPGGTKLLQVQGPPTQEIIDPVLGGKVAVWGSGEFVLNFSTIAPYAQAEFPISITFLGCTTRICLFPYTVTIKLPTFAQPVQKNPTPTTQPLLQEPESNQAATAQIESLPANQDIEQAFADKIQRGELTYSVLLLVLFLGGLATNLTPCVFPMIPITLRILGRQGGNKWLSACLYALGIMITYSALGAVASFSGGVFGAYAGSTAFNAAFGIIFILLALSMLGFGNFAMLQNLGARFGNGKSNPLNTMLMGAGAGLVAAPCTGPILGGLLAYSAKLNDPNLSLALFVTYSLGFALPYVFLGGFAGTITKLKVSAKIQIAVKLAFAAIMFALALYYLRIPLREFLTAIKGYWLPSGLILGLAGLLLCGRYLFSTNTSKLATILPTMCLGLGIFALIQNISGEDIVSDIKIVWHHSLEAGRKAAEKDQKPILLDGWADWCAACKKMDVTTYQDPRVRQLIAKSWVAVKIDFTELTDELDAFASKYQMHGLPVTLLLPADGDTRYQKRMTGYISADDMLTELQRYQAD